MITMAKLRALQDQFRTLAKYQGCVYEANYHEFCHGITDKKVINRIGYWLLHSGLVLKQGIGDQYRQEVMQKVKNPSVEDVKDTKSRTHTNKNKLQKSKKDVDELVSASMHLNNIIEKFKDSEDEFLPVWKKKEAGTAIDLSGGRLPEGPMSMADVASTVEKLIPIDEQPAWIAILNGIVDQSGLNQFLRSLYERAQQPEQQSEPLPMEQPQTFEPDYGVDEPLELGSKLAKQGSITQTVAKFGYGSGDRWQVKFNNGVGVTAYVAETPIQKASGLEVFETLAPKEGLLFPFAEPDRVTFHMGSVGFPIDIIFLTSADLSGLEVGKIIHNVQPGVPDQWSHPDTVAVLEVNGGKCKELGIAIGATCGIRTRVQSA